MKATGMVRRIDELGRIVIPKEMRRTLGMKEGEQLEIYTEDNESVVLKKYSVVKKLSDYAQAYTEAVNKATGCICIITDNDKIISVSGCAKNSGMGEKLSAMLMEITSRRQQFVSQPYTKSVDICRGVTFPDESFEIISPIICDGSVCGAVIIISEQYLPYLKDYAATGASFLGNIMQF